MEPVRAPNEDPSPGAPSVPPKAQGSLLAKAARGAFWIILSGAGARVLGIVGTLAVTYYLSPDEYGEASLAALVMLTASTLANCGMSQYVASKPNAGRAAVFHATFYFVLTGVFSVALMVLLSGPIGVFVNAPHIGRLLLPLAGATCIDRLCTIQDRILLRDMRFRLVSAQRSVGELIYSVVSVSLAATCAGTIFGGAYALVWGTAARGLVRLVILSVNTPWREWLEPHPITREQTREFFSFGRPMWIASVAAFGSSKFDNFVFSHHFGTKAVGIYNLAYNFADMPAALIADAVGDVLVPSLARMESDERRRDAFPLALRTLVLLVTPLGMGMAMVAPNLIKLAFQPRYHAVIQMLRILSLFVVPRTVIWTATAYLQVRNEPRRIMLVDILRMLGIVTCMHLTALGMKSLVAAKVHAVKVLASLASVDPRSFSVLVVCGSVGVVFALSALSYMVVIRKLDGASLKAQILPLLPPSIACIPMVLAIWALRRTLFKLGMFSVVDFAAGEMVPFSTRAAMFGPRLLLEVVVGGLVYVPSALLLAPRASRDFLDLVRDSIRRRRGGGASKASIPPAPDTAGAS